MQVRLDEIVYVHCHQDSETGGTVILVGQDGVQRPPIHFPKGSHVLRRSVDVLFVLSFIK